jgi:hypothetical protein
MRDYADAMWQVGDPVAPTSSTPVASHVPDTTSDIVVKMLAVHPKIQSAQAPLKKKRKDRSLITLAFKQQLRQQCAEVQKEQLQQSEHVPTSPRMDPVSEASENRVNFCPECGHNFRPSFQFCWSCGISLNAINHSLGLMKDAEKPVSAQWKNTQPPVSAQWI